MKCHQFTVPARHSSSCLLFFLVFAAVFIDGTSASADPEIISTETEIIAYPNHTAKLSCVVQHKTRHHVTWSRVNFINETQKLTSLLFVDSLKYTPFSRYHLTHLIENDNREYWNLEIRHVHPSDQGYYSCVLTAIRPISKTFHLQVLEHTRNPSLALRSTSDMQRRAKEQVTSSSSFILSSISSVFLTMTVVVVVLTR